ncbi:Cytochrome c oxidase subunit 7C, mitochondrial [Melipona quadrifasciata]|uniref:Cytochrome c oxidase subunit 7C, mitochondrial n=1 Tax=Melipona quadrifasciata TaxID=166423 RepID=A0A0M8ZY97_9HYME|nr:Cytochrome c oxidase subunit 7C, mitochondrial [Melipona quadrifasciata]
MSALRSVLRRFTRSFKTTSVRRSEEHDPEGFPGANFPFDITNRYKLIALFIVFTGTGISVPFAVLHYHLNLK